MAEFHPQLGRLTVLSKTGEIGRRGSDYSFFYLIT